MPLCAVLFDLDDTLWAYPDFDRALLAKQYALARRHLGAWPDLPPDEAILDAVSEVIMEEVERWRTLTETQTPTTGIIEQALARLGVASVSVEALAAYAETVFDYLAVHAEAIEPPAGTAEVLSDLRGRGLRLGIVTNNVLSTGQVRRILRRIGINDLVDALVVSSETPGRKPHRGVFDAALSALDSQAEQAIFVGDRLEYDIAGAKALGMRTVLTRQFRCDEAASDGVTPDYVIDHLRELPAIVASLQQP